MKKRVYLFCSQGMSTSMLAQKMQKVADENKFPMEVEAHPHGTIAEVVQSKHPDVIMLGPQVKYLYDETVAKFSDSGIPVLMIASEDYGSMNGAKVLKQALVALKNNKGGA